MSGYAYRVDDSCDLSEMYGVCARARAELLGDRVAFVAAAPGYRFVCVWIDAAISARSERCDADVCMRAAWSSVDRYTGYGEFVRCVGCAVDATQFDMRQMARRSWCARVDRSLEFQGMRWMRAMGLRWNTRQLHVWRLRARALRSAHAHVMRIARRTVTPVPVRMRTDLDSLFGYKLFTTLVLVACHV